MVEKWQEASQLGLSNQGWDAQSSDGEGEDMDLGLAAQAAPIQQGKRDLFLRFGPIEQAGGRGVGSQPAGRGEAPPDPTPPS